jgi:hypothetical protein
MTCGTSRAHTAHVWTVALEDDRARGLLEGLAGVNGRAAVVPVDHLAEQVFLVSEGRQAGSGD